MLLHCNRLLWKSLLPNYWSPVFGGNLNEVFYDSRSLLYWVVIWLLGTFALNEVIDFRVYVLSNLHGLNTKEGPISKHKKKRLFGLRVNGKKRSQRPLTRQLSLPEVLGWESWSWVSVLSNFRLQRSFLSPSLLPLWNGYCHFSTARDSKLFINTLKKKHTVYQ